MFKQKVTKTALTEDIANDFFNNIRGDAYDGDVSFVSTLRALVAPRMKQDESITLYFKSSNYTESQLTDSTLSNSKLVECIVDVDSYPQPNGLIIVHNFSNISQSNNFAWMRLMESSFTKRYPDWVRLEKVTEFYRKSFGVICFINPVERNVVIFTDDFDVRKMHYLQCSILAFLPWYFDPQKGVSKAEMDLIESLRGKNVSAYTDCLEKIALQYDFRTAKIQKYLYDFETRYERIECERIRNKIERYIESIDGLSNQIGEYLKMKNEDEIKLLGLENKIESGAGESEIMDYFIRNKNLALDNVSNTVMTFSVKTYLEYFDEDMAESAINNSTSYVYRPNGRGCNNIIPADDMKKLMTALFIDQTLKVRVCAAYQFDINGNVSAISHHSYSFECNEFTPNPHIDEYRCLGNYSRAICTLLKKRDYIGAIEQCVASCKSLNFGDSPVMCEFMKRLYGISNYQDTINTRCIELPNGNVVTPKEAIDWIHSQEVNSDE